MTAKKRNSMMAVISSLSKSQGLADEGAIAIAIVILILAGGIFLEGAVNDRSIRWLA